MRQELCTDMEEEGNSEEARGGEAQRADATARHQGRSTSGGGKIGPKYRGVICIFSLHTGGLSKMNPRIFRGKPGKIQINPQYGGRPICSPPGADQL